MRKLIWCVVLSVVGFVGAEGPGCSSAVSLCSGACADYNNLHCGLQCDCSACGVAPPECDSYYNCIQAYSGSCLNLVVACPIPAQCQGFVSSNCK